jgi:hypothetical protein
MPCPICDQKPANCDCTAQERRLYAETHGLEGEVERLRDLVRFQDRVIRSMDVPKMDVPKTVHLSERDRDLLRFAANTIGDADCAALFRRLLKDLP